MHSAVVSGRTDPRFRTNADRLAHREYLLKEIRAILYEKTKEYWMDTLEAAGVPCAPILTIPEVLAQPQTAAMEIFRQQPGIDIVLAHLPFSLMGSGRLWTRPRHSWERIQKRFLRNNQTRYASDSVSPRAWFSTQGSLVRVVQSDCLYFFAGYHRP